MCQVPGLVVAMLVHAHAHTRFGRHGRYVEALQATFDKYKAEVVARVCVYVRKCEHARVYAYVYMRVRESCVRMRVCVYACTCGMRASVCGRWSGSRGSRGGHRQASPEIKVTSNQC